MQEDAGSSTLCMTGKYSYSLYISLRGLPLLERKHGLFWFTKNTENAGGKRRKTDSQFLAVTVQLALGFLLQGLLILTEPPVGGPDAA